MPELGPYPVADDYEGDCMCIRGNGCGVCYDSVGPDPEVDCPDCPLHGYTNIAKRRQAEILERIAMPDKKEELTDAEREAMNEKSIQSSIATYDENSTRPKGIY